jgi:hypothetical protein
MVDEEKRKRRRLTDIEEDLRTKGTIGCHCLCPIIHPHKPEICTGAAQRNVPMFKGTDIQIDVPMCESCAAIHA